MPIKLAGIIRGLTTDPLMVMILVSGMLLTVGMFLESNAAYIMLVPLFNPIALSFRIDPLHFAFIFVLNLVIGMLTRQWG